MDLVRVFFSLKGRINRKTYWLAMMVLVVLIVISIMMEKSIEETLQRLGVIMYLVLVWPLIAVGVKRGHDLNMSGWWFLINIIPFGTLLIISAHGFVSGTKGPNRYGFQPKGDIHAIPKDQESAEQYDPRINEKFPSYLPSQIRDLISMFAKIAKSDGAVSKSELTMVDNFFQRVLKFTSDEREEAVKIFNKAKFSPVVYEVYASGFYDHYRNNISLLKFVLDFLYALAWADGQLSSEGEILISQTIEIFGVEHEAFSSHRQKREESHEHRVRRNKESYYAEILGLKGKFKPEELKTSYRNLAMQYHPDKVSHLGPKLKQVADEEMKKINEAYSYFAGAKREPGN